MKNESERRVVAPFQDSSHPGYKTHYLKLRPYAQRVVPMCVGKIPRRDNIEEYPRYCRAMLLIFKPWRKCDDLIGANESWQDAFSNFLANDECPETYVHIMRNMQVLHECKDSRD
ncbi:hypothetical protein FPV67DRAFT_1409799, partial [Lyophyllum atratum]